MLDRDPSVPPCNDKEEGGVSLNQLRTTTAISRAETMFFHTSTARVLTPPVFFENDRLSILLLAAMTKLESTTALGVKTIVV